MINVNIEERAIIDLMQSFNKAGFVDGFSLMEEEISKEERLIYWQDLLESNEGKKKQDYIVFNVIPNNVGITYADDKEVYKKQLMGISYFTTEQPMKKNVFTNREKLEKCLIDDGWFVEYSSRYYDMNSKLYQYVYSVSKYYGEV